MAEVIKMPRMSDTMEEGVIVEWLKNVGDSVEPGDVLAEVETDKATMELESYESGTLLYIGVEKGKSVEVDSVIAILGEKGENYETALEATKKDTGVSKSEEEKTTSDKKEADAKQETKSTATSSSAETFESAPRNNERLFASPLAKKIAKEKGIDLSIIQGSGDGGRIIKRDLENVSASTGQIQTQAGVVGQESYREVDASQMRKAITRTLSGSKFTAPHFYLNVEVDMDKAMEARKSLNEISPVKISFNDIVVKAAAMALKKHPSINSSWLENNKIRYYEHIHVGVAVSVDEGLVVPVLRFVDGKTLSQISAETKDYAAKARDKKLQPADYEGGTFAVSNLGMFGIDTFTAIINPPNACILAVGAINQVPVVKDGAIVPGNRMKMTLSCDHRVVDGATGAQFLKTLKDLLEEPVKLLV